MFDQKTIEALATLRTYAQKYPSMGLSGALNTLDNAGVFAALDEQTEYAAAEEILADRTAYDITPVDPAEWGDTTRADMARHQGVPFSDTHPRAAHELASILGLVDDPADIQAAVDRANTGHDPSVCDAGPLASPALHAGTCPVWARHHNLA